MRSALAPVHRRVLVLTTVVGLLGGAVGAAYVGALTVLTDLVGPDAHGPGTTVVVLVAVGGAISLLVRFLGDPGDVELLVDNVHVSGGSRDLRALRSLLPASLLGIAAGSAIGPEAPLVQTGGTLATRVGDAAAAPPAHVRMLAIAGMASAFAVLFGAPLGSALFALEILHRRGLEHHEAILPALGGALIGFGASAALGSRGYGPTFSLPDTAAGSLADAGWALLAAVVGAAIAVAFTLLVRACRRGATLLPRLVRPAVGGLVLGLLGLWSTYALTFGEHQIDELLAPGVTVGVLAAAVAAKLLGASVCVATGWKGGFIIPLFFCGAAAALLLHHAVPGVEPGLLMASCMVAANVGVTKTPLGTALVVTEMGGLHLLPSTALAALVALLLTSDLHLIASQRARTAAP